VSLLCGIKENEGNIRDVAFCGNFVFVYLQAELQWLQNPSQINADKLQNLRRETSKIFRKKKR
jgi:hypothetical protein